MRFDDLLRIMKRCVARRMTFYKFTMKQLHQKKKIYETQKEINIETILIETRRNNKEETIQLRFN